MVMSDVEQGTKNRSAVEDQKQLSSQWLLGCSRCNAYTGRSTRWGHKYPGENENVGHRSQRYLKPQYADEGQQQFNRPADRLVMLKHRTFPKLVFHSSINVVYKSSPYRLIQISRQIASKCSVSVEWGGSREVYIPLNRHRHDVL